MRVRCGGLGFVVVVLFLATLGCGPSGSQKAVVEKPRAEFGAMGQQEERTHIFEVKNGGGKPLTLLGIKDTCPCTKSQLLDTTIAPGKVGRVETVFHSLWFNGEEQKKILLSTDDPTNPEITLHVSATVEVDLELKPRVHHLGSVMAGNPVAATTYLLNHTDRPITILSATPKKEGLTLLDPLPLVLEPGKAHQLQTEMVAPAGRGSYINSLLLEVEGARPGTFKIVYSGRYR